MHPCSIRGCIVSKLESLARNEDYIVKRGPFALWLIIGFYDGAAFGITDNVADKIESVLQLEYVSVFVIFSL